MKIKLAVAAALLSASSLAIAAGDAGKGKALYAGCSGCHGADAMGNAALNAPRLAGQLEGYLVVQLNNFKAGIRGTADGDLGGAMMRPMASMLADDQAVQDVAAYLASLK
ncbi:MAG: c-type cytochrome [Gammaproteobacteria bacterium]|nr:c-type cytochrome [Gammaproteobacteria bacterium]